MPFYAVAAMKTSLTAIAIGVTLALPSFAGTPGKAAAVITPPKEEIRRAITYDFVEAGYASNLGLESGDLYGGYVNVSFSPVSNMYVFGRFYGFGGDDTGVDVSAGVGGYVPLYRDMDFILEAGYNYFDAADDGESSFFVSPGFRVMVTPKLELNGNATVTFPEEGDTSVALGGGFVYYLKPNLGVTAGYYYDLEDQSHFYQAGMRYLW